jgi:hypothetical protein
VLTHTAKEFYVNISVKGKAIGTVSNLEGHFSLKMHLYQKMIIYFSHLNFDRNNPLKKRPNSTQR